MGCERGSLHARAQTRFCIVPPRPPHSGSRESSSAPHPPLPSTRLLDAADVLVPHNPEGQLQDDAQAPHAHGQRAPQVGVGRGRGDAYLALGVHPLDGAQLRAGGCFVWCGMAGGGRGRASGGTLVLLVTDVQRTQTQQRAAVPPWRYVATSREGGMNHRCLQLSAKALTWFERLPYRRDDPWEPVATAPPAVDGDRAGCLVGDRQGCRTTHVGQPHRPVGAPLALLYCTAGDDMAGPSGAAVHVQ